jgi:hypothetical protein
MNRHGVQASVCAMFLFSLTGCATSGDLDSLRTEIRSLRGAVQFNEKQSHALRTSMEGLDSRKADSAVTKQLQNDLKTLETKWAFVIEELGSQHAALRKTVEEMKRGRASDESAVQARLKDVDAMHRQHADFTANLAGLQSEVTAYSTRMQSLIQILLRTYHTEIATLQGQAREIEQAASALETKGEKRR